MKEEDRKRKAKKEVENSNHLLEIFYHEGFILEPIYESPELSFKKISFYSITESNLIQTKICLRHEQSKG